MALCTSYSFNAGSPTDGRKPTIKTGNRSFFLRKNSSSSVLSSYLSYKKCLFHRWRICLALKCMYLNKVSHLSQLPIFAAHLILKTMTVQTYLSSWGKFMKFLKFFSFLDEVWNNIQDSIKGNLHQTSIFRGHIAYSCSFNRGTWPNR